MAKSHLHELTERGQSVWFDTLSRDLVQSGGLKRMMDEDAVTGVTSNPTIFQKALAEGDAYDEQLKGLVESGDDPTQTFFALALDDIRDACDVLRPAYDSSGGVDGFVSMEVEPGIAYDTRKSFEQARWIAGEVARPNLYVKIPATEAGLPAIEDCIAHGTPINITLIFSLRRYEAVVEAYLRGLERLVAGGGDPSPVVSVASFFVSRVDTEADKRLEALGRQDLEGKLAVANAKLAYQHYLQAFSGSRWDVSRRQGRPPAALSVGVHVHQEPRLQRRHVRRGSDRARHGEHDAARDDRGVPGSRSGRAATLSSTASTRRDSSSTISQPPASTTTT